MTTTRDDLVENDVVTAFRLQHLDGGSFDHNGPIITTPPGGEPTVEDITAHELSHFWLHASTPYGLILDELGELQKRATLEYCARLYRADYRIPIAAYDVAHELFAAPPTESDAYRSLLRQLAIDHVVPWTHDVLLERWLEGLNLRTVRAARLDRMLHWIVDFEERSRAVRPDTELFADVPPDFSDYQRNFVRWWGNAVAEDPSRWPAHPTIGPIAGEMQPLGGRHLFETHAQLSETVDEPFWQTAPEDHRSLYWGLLGAFVRRYPGGVHDEDSYTSMVTTFAAVVDLALLVPVGRVYGRMREDGMNWLDLHPGWRFEQLLGALRDDDWLQDTGDAVRKLLGSLSSRCGWRPPDRFYELGASLEPVTTEVARHAAACRARLEEPDRLAVRRALPDRVGPTDHFAEHGPIVIRGTVSFVPGADTNEKLTRLLGFAIARMAFMVMQDGHIDVDAIFPEDLDFTNVFDNIQSREDLLETFYEALPFLATDAFCSADELDALA